MRLSRWALLVLMGCASTGRGDEVAFRAGAAKVKITPAEMGWMTGYGSRNKRAESVHDDLFARALAVDDGAGTRVVLVTADILGFPPALSREIRRQAREKYGLAEGQLILNASHTHGGPTVPERPSPYIFNGLDEEGQKPILEYGAWLRGKVLDLVGQALRSLEPAKLSVIRTEAGFGINRRVKRADGTWGFGENKEGAHDPDVPVLWVESTDARVRAVVFTYACHCTTMGGVYQYNADYAGVACALVEKMLPGCTAFYFTGCGADLNPTPRGKGFELADRHGQALAQAVIGASREEYGEPRTIRGPIRTGFRNVGLPLDQPPARDLLEKLAAHKDVFRQRHSKEMLRLMDAGKLPTGVDFPIAVWRFGEDLTVIALAGETCVDYALRLKRELGEERTWVAGYSGEVPCYIPSDRVLAESGYEAGWDAGQGRAVASGSMLYYGWPVPLAAGLEERIVTAVHDLVGR